MAYKIEIWRYHEVVDEYEDKSVGNVLKWYRNHWKRTYDFGGCFFDLLENGKEVDWDTQYELGFFRDEGEER